MNRIVAAWRVLRGEWVAGPPKVEEPKGTFYVFDPTATGTSPISTTYWRRTG